MEAMTDPARPLTELSAAWEALRQAIWENAPSYDPRDFIQDHRPAIEAAALAARSSAVVGLNRETLAAAMQATGKQGVASWEGWADAILAALSSGAVTQPARDDDALRAAALNILTKASKDQRLEVEDFTALRAALKEANGEQD